MADFITVAAKVVSVEVENDVGIVNVQPTEAAQHVNPSTALITVSGIPKANITGVNLVSAGDAVTLHLSKP